MMKYADFDKALEELGNKAFTNGVMAMRLAIAKYFYDVGLEDTARCVLIIPSPEPEATDDC